MTIEKEIANLKSWQTDLSRQIERLEDKVGRIELRLDRAGKIVGEYLNKAEKGPESDSGGLSGQDDSTGDPQNEP